jgi:hypothetical protein
MSIDPTIEKKIIEPKIFQLLPEYNCQFSVAFNYHPRWPKIFGHFWSPDWVIKFWLPNFLNNAQNFLITFQNF